MNTAQTTATAPAAVPMLVLDPENPTPLIGRFIIIHGNITGSGNHTKLVIRRERDDNVRIGLLFNPGTPVYRADDQTKLAGFKIPVDEAGTERFVRLGTVIVDPVVAVSKMREEENGEIKNIPTWEGDTTKGHQVWATCHLIAHNGLMPPANSSARASSLLAALPA